MAKFQFGTVGSPISTPKKPGGSIGAIQQISALELNAFELAWVQSVRVSEETCQAIQNAGIEYQVALSIHAPYFINLNADEVEWPKSRKRLMDAAYYGNLAGATDIIFHPGSYFGKPSVEVLKVALPRLNECVRELRSMENLVVLRPETMGKAAMLGSLEDTLIMSAEIPGIEPCLDFAHLHARQGDGSMNSREEWLMVLDKYSTALGVDSLKRLHIHLSGIQYGPKGEKNHLPISASDLNLRDLFLALQETGSQGRILCESPVLEEDALLMKQLWSDLMI